MFGCRKGHFKEITKQITFKGILCYLQYLLIRYFLPSLILFVKVDLILNKVTNHRKRFLSLVSSFFIIPFYRVKMMA